MSTEAVAAPQRRPPKAPLVLVVHGRQGGLIAAELQHLAGRVAEIRQAPVLLQTLAQDAPQPDAAFRRAAAASGAAQLVPLLLLPGGHVRLDLPRISRAWQRQLAGAGLQLRRCPFLGAWPGWQRRLARLLARAARRTGSTPVWLHHPLEGELSQRYLRHLAGVFNCEGIAASFRAPPADLPLPPDRPLLLMPLTLAANRLSESLAACSRETALVPAAPQSPPIQPSAPITLPPLLQLSGPRRFLIRSLELLP